MFDQVQASYELQTAEIRDLAQEQATKTFSQLTFLDSAELALVGGGGASGGNCL